MGIKVKSQNETQKGNYMKIKILIGAFALFAATSIVSAPKAMAMQQCVPTSYGCSGGYFLTQCHYQNANCYTTTCTWRFNSFEGCDTYYDPYMW